MEEDGGEREREGVKDKERRLRVGRTEMGEQYLASKGKNQN